MRSGMLGNNKALLHLWNGPLLDLAFKLNSEEGTEWEANLKRFLRGEMVAKQPALLQKVATARVADAIEFVVANHIHECNVGCFNNTFKESFWGKVETGSGIETSLVVHSLKRDSLDAPILTELGDNDGISLAHLFGLLKKQSKGEKGVLSVVPGHFNIAYTAFHWAVFAGWTLHGFWELDAALIGFAGSKWGAGDRVISQAITV